MRYPEAILVPVLMFADYFLTLVGQIQKEKKYAQHFRTDYYELNPIWQKHVDEKKWFNPRHVLLVVILSAALLAVLEGRLLPPFMAHILLGAVLVTYGTVAARHLANLMTFHALVKMPDDISGQVKMAHALVLAMSANHYVSVVVPVFLVGIFAPSPFAAGGMLGLTAFFAVHLFWIRRHRKSTGLFNNRAQNHS